jgi:hypothetical protein
LFSIHWKVVVSLLMPVKNASKATSASQSVTTTMPFHARARRYIIR